MEKEEFTRPDPIGELDIEKQFLSYKSNWPCLELFRSTIKCLEDNEDEIGHCQTTVKMLHRCVDNVQPLTIAIRVKNMIPSGDFITKNRFLSTADDFGREENIVQKTLEKIAPTLFNEEERAPSKITEALQQNLPRIFTDDDDDDDDDDD